MEFDFDDEDMLIYDSARIMRREEPTEDVDVDIVEDTDWNMSDGGIPGELSRRSMPVAMVNNRHDINNSRPSNPHAKLLEGKDMPQTPRHIRTGGRQGFVFHEGEGGDSPGGHIHMQHHHLQQPPHQWAGAATAATTAGMAIEGGIVVGNRSPLPKRQRHGRSPDAQDFQVIVEPSPVSSVVSESLRWLTPPVSPNIPQHSPHGTSTRPPGYNNFLSQSRLFSLSQQSSQAGGGTNNNSTTYEGMWNSNNSNSGGIPSQSKPYVGGPIVHLDATQSPQIGLRAHRHAPTVTAFGGDSGSTPPTKLYAGRTSIDGSDSDKGSPPPPPSTTGPASSSTMSWRDSHGGGGVSPLREVFTRKFSLSG